MKRSYVLNMYFMSGISTTLRSDVLIGKFKCLVRKPDNYCHLFLRQKRQSAAVKVNWVSTCNWLVPTVYWLFEASRVDTCLILLLWSKQGWYLNCFASYIFFTSIINLDLQYTFVAVSVETKTDHGLIIWQDPAVVTIKGSTLKTDSLSRT